MLVPVLKLLAHWVSILLDDLPELKVNEKLTVPVAEVVGVTVLAAVHLSWE